MNRRRFVTAICTVLAAPLGARAQPAGLYRIGVIFQGGPYAAAIDGLRDGLKELGLAEGSHYVFHLRDMQSNLGSVDTAARALELEKVDLIYAISTSTTLAVKRATARVPIVFYAGTDPVTMGLIADYRRPGGRLTGIHSRFSDLTGKRLQLLKTLLPKLSRVITFYDPGNPVSTRSVKLAQDAGQRLNIEVIARKASSVEELRGAVRALQPREADAVFFTSDGMVISQTPLVIDGARSKKLPTMLNEETYVGKGALASYGVSYYVCGRLAAKYVQRIRAGASAGELPIEQIDTPHFTVNLKAARDFDLKIPDELLARADKVVR